MKLFQTRLWNALAWKELLLLRLTTLWLFVASTAPCTTISIRKFLDRSSRSNSNSSFSDLECCKPQNSEASCLFCLILKKGPCVTINVSKRHAQDAVLLLILSRLSFNQRWFDCNVRQRHTKSLRFKKNFRILKERRSNSTIWCETDAKSSRSSLSSIRRSWRIYVSNSSSSKELMSVSICICFAACLDCAPLSSFAAPNLSWISIFSG